ncbi:NAD(P)H-hydrate dehydratase [Anoxybacteroides amylolyticum]|uniref:Bifunctional NAD(P)H-hydrate repair enzyme n=1 Tax=Anoxybacteroides amylolyticum TaxID=294699 RepID=A0A160F295_9BACL|nr:NAD(P)H-hydrate dehydratase [Anoxybacillus amylolyticus]ANB59812.1 phosphomethylpyrimidine kinase family protein [Anoxybacillus amylolyticus]
MRVVTASEMYAIDRYTIEKVGISEDTLMENAGQAIATILRERFDKTARIAILAGSGNNGGDGVVTARVLKSEGYNVDLWLIPSSEKMKGAAKRALDIYQHAGYEAKSYIEHSLSLERYDVIVDALLGIGVKGEVRSPYKEIIQEVNNIDSLTVYAIDLPSGIPADGGEVEIAIQADVTMTVQYPKLSAYTFPTADYYGELVVVDIGIPPRALEIASFCQLWTEADVKQTLPVRKRSSHKGTYGKALIIGGSRPMPGAITLTAKAALRSGAGLLTMAVPDDIYPVVANRIPEAMLFPCQTETGYFAGAIDFASLDVDAIAIGPGMGRTAGTNQIVQATLAQDVPVVLDADALFFWKEYAFLLKTRTKPTVITPHPGELARMLQLSIQEVEKHRFTLSKQLATDYGIYVVLKGPYTIVTTPDGKQYINATGNPALAKGGSGDVLTGIIVAFLMQHDSIQTAVSNAVFVHGKAADWLVQHGHSPHSVLATDVIDALPSILFELRERPQ